MNTFRTPYLFRWIFHRRVWGFSLSSANVYLTFDDGPTEECTDWILQELKKHNVVATFFCVGSNAKNHPELISRIEQDSHALGNHTMKHEKGTQTSKKAYLDSIDAAAEHINSNLFRPPYGRVPMRYTKDIRSSYNLVMWTWLSYDYDESVEIETILKSAQSIKGGDILVLHDNLKSFERLKIILPELIKIIKGKNLEFAVISA